MNTVLLSRHKFDIGVQTHIMLRRGEVLHTIKENQCYKGQADSFAEYLAQDDVRSDARICMDIYKFYCLHSRVPAEDIQDIHYLRLHEAMKAIKLQPDKLSEWLECCRTLSWKDLINKVRGVRQKPPLQSKSPPFDESPDSPCLLHPERKAEQAHWPITAKMGGKFTIPLCRACHNEYHDIGDVSFYSKYKRKIGEWLETL